MSTNEFFIFFLVIYTVNYSSTSFYWCMVQCHIFSLVNFVLHIFDALCFVIIWARLVRMACYFWYKYFFILYSYHTMILGERSSTYQNSKLNLQRKWIISESSSILLLYCESHYQIYLLLGCQYISLFENLNGIILVLLALLVGQRKTEAKKS